MKQLDEEWAALFYQVGEGKASEIRALNELDVVDFYRLLSNHIKHYKAKT